MEHLASAIGMDPLEFRTKNIPRTGELVETQMENEDKENPALTVIEQVKNSSNFMERKQEIIQYNRV